jgi:hypothetical protein
MTLNGYRTGLLLPPEPDPGESRSAHRAAF